MCRAKSTICPTVWVFYADILSTSFEVTTNSEDMRMAEMLCRDALSLCADGHPLTSTIYHALSSIYRRKFRQNRDEAFIEEAVRLRRVGLEQLPETEFHNRHRHLNRLAAVLMEQHLYGAHKGQDEEHSIMSEAFRLCPPMHVDRWMVQSQMMWQLLLEYDRSGELGFLNKAIELGSQALNMGNFPNPSRRAYFLFRMADSLRDRYQIAGTNGKDLEESVKLYRKASQIILPSDANHSIYLSGLTSALVTQFRWDGDVNHLEEASQLYHRASDIMSTAYPWWPITICGRAHVLGLRFKETGDISELNRAIDLDEKASAAMRPSALNYSGSTLQMISHLCLRFEILHKNDDLEKAITVAEKFLESLHDGDLNRPKAIIILEKARLRHTLDKNSVRHIDLAIEKLLAIKDQLSRFDWCPESLRTLAACYVAKFRRSSAIDAALGAKDAIDEVLKSVNPDHYERFQCLVDAAKIYLEPGTPYHNIEIALERLSDALGSTHRDVRSKIHGAKDVLDKIEAEHHDIFTTRSSLSLKLLDIIEFAVSLLPRIALFGIHPYARLQSLEEGQRIAMTGASHALSLSLPEKALEVMEQGRAIFWAHTLRLCSSFDDIPHDLRDRLLILARRLDKVVNASEDSMDQRYVDREIAQRRKDGDEFNSILERVRCLPGLEGFMLPDRYSALKDVAKKGPTVVLVSSSLACHAIILKSSEDVSIVPLEAVTNKWLVESSSVWRSTVIESRSAVTDGRKFIKSKKLPDSLYTQAKRILRLLWINIVFPVVQALQIEASFRRLPLEYQHSHNNTQPAPDCDRPRVWWCPTGCFAHLPIHAAGADGRWCSDYVVSSYTPTISSLLGARKEYKPVKKEDVKALVVAVPRSFSSLWGELVSTTEEVRTVKAALPKGSLVPIPGTIDSEDGDIGGVTASALLDKLPEATILHLACHGRQDPDNALNSGFVMSDEILTIERLMHVPLPQAFMAFLSACETAKGDEVSADTPINNINALTLNYILESSRPSSPPCGNDAVCRIQERDSHTLVRSLHVYA
jgi:hypothetical protein